MTISPALFPAVTVTVVRDRKIRTALRTNQIAGFVTVPSWKKIIAWYFLANGGSIFVEASSHRRHCKQLCGGMEIPCWVTFTFSRKAPLNWLKALLEVVIYANLRHSVQMFSQISRIPDLIRKFWAEKCCLYAGENVRSAMVVKVSFYRLCTQMTARSC